MSIFIDKVFIIFVHIEKRKYINLLFSPSKFPDLPHPWTSLCFKPHSYKGQLISKGNFSVPKNELENVNFCPNPRGQKVFIRFLGELKPNSPFEINLPLRRRCVEKKFEKIGSFVILQIWVSTSRKYLFQNSNTMTIFGSSWSLVCVKN